MKDSDDTNIEDHENSRAKEAFTKAFPEAPDLYALIFALGMSNSSAYNIDHLVDKPTNQHVKSSKY